MTAAEIEAFIRAQFPQAEGFGNIEAIAHDSLQMRLPFKDAYLRPGGTLSGPTLMSLADTATYYLLLAKLGPVALAVTTSLTMHFLRRPAARDAIAVARLLKLGKRIAVCDVLITVDGDDAPVAHATVSYALPPGTVVP
ncbi:MAG: PaaI family thioesterase [Deltaproteobacteria bacterium]|nr:PaaI family thioesterase [Deltaproteobacteria bacterium]